MTCDWSLWISPILAHLHEDTPDHAPQAALSEDTAVTDRLIQGKPGSSSEFHHDRLVISSGSDQYTWSRVAVLSEKAKGGRIAALNATANQLHQFPLFCRPTPCTLNRKL